MTIPWIRARTADGPRQSRAEPWRGRAGQGRAHRAWSTHRAAQAPLLARSLLWLLHSFTLILWYPFIYKSTVSKSTVSWLIHCSFLRFFSSVIPPSIHLSIHPSIHPFNCQCVGELAALPLHLLLLLLSFSSINPSIHSLCFHTPSFLAHVGVWAWGQDSRIALHTRSLALAHRHARPSCTCTYTRMHTRALATPHSHL